MPRTAPTIVSLRHDLVWFVAPGALAAIAGLCVGLLPATSEAREGGGLGLWIAGVLLVDVAHVYASLYRTYLDPQARRLHRKRLWLIPLLCLWFGVLLHLESPLLFWSALAYVAIFHFIKQHLGFALLYVRAGREDPIDRRLVTAAVWAPSARCCTGMLTSPRASPGSSPVTWSRERPRGSARSPCGDRCRSGWPSSDDACSGRDVGIATRCCSRSSYCRRSTGIWAWWCSTK